MTGNETSNYRNCFMMRYTRSLPACLCAVRVCVGVRTSSQRDIITPSQMLVIGVCSRKQSSHQKRSSAQQKQISRLEQRSRTIRIEYIHLAM